MLLVPGERGMGIVRANAWCYVRRDVELRLIRELMTKMDAGTTVDPVARRYRSGRLSRSERGSG
jgi:hypothetical protein